MRVENNIILCFTFYEGVFDIFKLKFSKSYLIHDPSAEMKIMKRTSGRIQIRRETTDEIE